MHDLHYKVLDESLIKLEEWARAYPGQPLMSEGAMMICLVLREVLAGLDSLMNRAIEQELELEQRHGCDVTMLTCCKAGHDFQVRGNRLLCPRCGEVR